MAGHSKWANIKHRKGKEDARRGQVFTKLARQITIAAKEGGADPASNFKLRLAIDKARTENMPNDNIERAINRGVGGLDGEDYEEILYEGYGPGGAALLIEVLTDNRNRAASEIRHQFSKFGGSLGEAGCVAWLFAKKGILVLDADAIDEDELMMVALEAGAEDVAEDAGIYRIVTDPSVYSQVKTALEEADYAFLASELTMVAENEVTLSETDLGKVNRLVEQLEDLDDVQQVHSNLK